MARIFWIVCPGCNRNFYAATDDFRGKDRDLLCPYCGKRFKDHEAKSLTD